MAQPHQGSQGQQGQQGYQSQQGGRRGQESSQEAGQSIHPGARGTQFTENQEIAHAMKGIDFPATRQDLVNQAQRNGAPQTIIGRLQELPDEEFGNAAAVMEVVGQKD